MPCSLVTPPPPQLFQIIWNADKVYAPQCMVESVPPPRATSGCVLTGLQLKPGNLENNLVLYSSNLVYITSHHVFTDKNGEQVHDRDHLLFSIPEQNAEGHNFGKAKYNNLSSPPVWMFGSSPVGFTIAEVYCTAGIACFQVRLGEKEFHFWMFSLCSFLP